MEYAPFIMLFLMAIGATHYLAYRAGKAREHMNTAARIIAAKSEAFERGRQSVMLFDDPEFQAVDKDETEP